MSRTALAALSLALAVVPALAQERTARLRTFTSSDGRFRAKMPRDVDVDRKELATGPGGVQTVPVTTARASGPGRTVFAVSYADYPEKFKTVPPKSVLDGVRDGLKGTDGKVVRDEETSVGSGDRKHTGREFRIEASDNAVRARVFLVENRLYQVMVTGPKSGVDSKSADEFLRSFELIGS